MTTVVDDQRQFEIAGRKDWRSLDIAPRDGTKIWLLVVHYNYRFARTAEEKRQWREICPAHWIDHNGGGWTWHGLCGRPTAWLPYEGERIDVDA